MIVWPQATPEVWTQLAAALLRASWQGGLLLTLLYGADRLLTNLPAHWRCWGWRLGYAKLLLLLALPFGIGLPVLAPRQTAEENAADVESPTGETVARQLMAGNAATDGDSSRDVRAAAPVHQIPAITTASVAVRWLLVLWLLGVALGVAQILRLAGQARQLRRSARRLTDAAALADYRQVAARLGVTPLPRLLVARSSIGPLALGGREPALLLPDRLIERLSPAELQLLLGHELAHVLRHDFLWNWLAAAVQCLFFFHPLVWLAARRWAQAQEMACDELAVLGARQPAAIFGHLLVNLAALNRQPRRIWSPALGVSASYGNLRERIVTMKRFSHESFNRNPLAAGKSLRARCGGAAVLLASLAAVLTPWQLVAAAAPQSTGGSSGSSSPGNASSAKSSSGQSSGVTKGSASFGSASSFASGSAGGSASGGSSGGGSTNGGGNGSGFSGGSATAGGSVQIQIGGGPDEKASESSPSAFPKAGSAAQNLSQPNKPALNAGSNQISKRRVSTFTDNDRTVVIREYPSGKIVVEVEQLVGDEEETQKYSARNEKELAEKYPQAYELYKRHGGDQAATGAALPPGAGPGFAGATGGGVGGQALNGGQGLGGATGNPAKQMLREQVLRMREQQSNPELKRMLDQTLEQIDAQPNAPVQPR